MSVYFNINYEFELPRVHEAIDRRVAERHPGYICVSDGVILVTANRDAEYRNVINSGMFSICDSSFVPLYIRLIHGHKFNQYAGADIFRDIVSSRKYRMIFLGTSRDILSSLQSRISGWNPDVADMKFIELPFCEVDDFDYPSIAETIADDGADIIWIALGAPKQERFMHRLLPHLRKGVMIAVGAAFKFYSDDSQARAPQWMINNHLEFVYRIYREPRKQLRRCAKILAYLPAILFKELKNKKKKQ